MSIARATQRQVNDTQELHKAASDGYMRAYGQVHDTPDGKFCWMGRIDRAYTMTAKAEDEVNKRRMEKAVQQLIGLAQKDFIEGERAHADYVDACGQLGITPQEIEPGCQCEYCQRVPRGAELLAEGFNGQVHGV